MPSCAPTPRPRNGRPIFDAAKDSIAPALDFLDTRQLGALSEPEQRLMNLTLAFAHIAIAVEIQGPDEAKHAKLRAHMKIVRSTADTAAGLGG